MLQKKIITGKEGSKFALQSFYLDPNPTIVDYLQSGWIMSLVAAIDFTASNGDPTLETSNHSTVQPVNDYEKVLTEMCNAIQVENYNEEDEDE